jgi:flagellar hook-associated protein 2
MESLSVGGLVSGLDTNSIIDGLSNIEQLKVDRIESKKEDLEDKQEAFDELVNRVGSLSTAASSLNKLSSFNLYKATSNDDEIVTVSGTEAATQGVFEIEVLSLATTQKVSSGAFASQVSQLGFSGEIEFSKTAAAIENNPVETTSQISVLSTDSLKDIANKINGADGIGVSASILTLTEGENRLVLTSKDEGSQGFFLNNVVGDVFGSSGLGILQDTQSTQSEFNFLLEDGGAATETDTFDKLATGIGLNNLTSGDALRISGTRADGSAVASTDWIFDPATDSIRDFLNEIETAFGGTVDANLNDSGEIVMVDNTSGLTEMTLDIELVDDGSGSTLNLGSSVTKNVFQNALSEGKKSFFKIDGLAVSSFGNTEDGIVQGTKINLHKADPGEVVKVSLRQDNDGIVNKIQTFVDEYNSFFKFVDEKTNVEVDEDGERTSVSKKGPLAGDSTVRRLKNEIQRLFTSQVQELEGVTQFSSLSRIGITSAKSNGHLEVDKEELVKALESDFDGVRRLFAASGVSDNPEWELGRYTDDTESGVYSVDADGNTMDGNSAKRIGLTLTSSTGDSKGLSLKAASGTGSFTFIRGLASQMEQYYAQANDYVSGLFKDTRESFDRQLREFDKRILDTQDRVDRYKATLTKQFADLEQSVSRLQSQQQSFAAQIGSL